ncbi:MAG: fumarylacetoacetate hydrolase [Deinococcus-Thermus bacterium]|nr:fumarylacetoacetate hydrolase [Deinococcota bacterium]
MRLLSLTDSGGPLAAVATPRGPVALSAIAELAGAGWPRSVEALIHEGRLDEVRSWLDREAGALADFPVLRDATPAPLLRRPPKILGVGLNYAEHAGDLGETRPDEPATFMKPSTTIIGPGEEIVLPRQSQRTTGEAELALIVERRCRDVPVERAGEVLAGVTTVIDMTAEDILQRNPRFLTRAKSFDTFLAIGSELAPVDELDGVSRLEVITTHGGRPARRNTVANMLHGPWELVAFFSSVMTLEPGDLISTGTPGAVVLAGGDEVGCEIEGVGRIACPVRDAKRGA